MKETKRNKIQYQQQNLKRFLLTTLALAAEALAKNLPKTEKFNYKILKNETLESNSSISATIESSPNKMNYVFLVMPNNGKIQQYEVTVSHSFSGTVIKTFNCSGFCDSVCPIDITYDPVNPQYTVKVVNVNSFKAENISLIHGDFFPNFVQEKTRFITPGISGGEFKVGVSFENLDDVLPSNFEKNDYRIKFSFDKKTVGESVNQFLKMKIEGDDITETASLVAEETLSLSNGVVKTHTNSKNCPEKGCIYYVTVSFNNIMNLNFLTSTVGYQQLIDFDQTVTINDEVTPEKNLVFQFEKSNPSNWEFILVPLKGNPDLFINTSATHPQEQSELDHYNWISKQLNNQERIIITKKECEKKQSDCKGFYVVVKSDSKSRSSFTLVIKTSISDNPQYFLDMNIPFTGRVEENEVIQFIVDLTPEVPETLRATVDLTKISSQGNPDLYVKDCENEADCYITKKDMIMAEQLSQNSNNFFRFSKEDNNIDRVYIEINLKPFKGDYQFKNHHYTSKFNRLAIGIKGNRNESVFMLNFNAETPHIRLEEESMKRVAIIQGQKKHFLFRTFKNMSDISTVLFRFVEIKGEMNAYISKSNKYPNKENNDYSLILKPPASFFDLEEKFFSISDTKDGDISGDYYITLEGVKTSFVGIETSYLEKDASKYKSMKLRIGNSYERVINGSTGFMHKEGYDEYRFLMDSQQGRMEEYTIKITNIVGKVNICVKVRDTDFKPEEQCDDYESLLSNEVYSLNSLVGLLSHTNEVHIKVTPVNNSTEIISSPDLFIKYRIVISRIGDINDIYFGYSHYGYVKEKHPQFFRVSFPFDYFTKFAAVNFQTFQLDPKIKAQLKLEATLDPKNDRLQNSNSTKSIIADNGNIVFSLKDLREYCSSFGMIDEPDNINRRRNLQILGGPEDYNWRDNSRKDKEDKINPDYDLNTNVTAPKYYSDLCTIHFKLSTSNTQFAKFRVTPISEQTTINLKNGTFDYFPAPSHNNMIFTYDLLEETEDVSLSLYTDYQETHVTVELFDYNLYFTNSFDSQSLVVSGRTQITLNVKEFKKQNVTHPYAQITIIDKKRLKEKYYEPFNNEYFLGIKVSSEVEYLLPHELIHKKGVKGNFKYFLVEADTNDTLLISLNVDGEGDADLYINPGKYNYTSQDNYFKKSAGLSDDEITLTVEDHKEVFSINKVLPLRGYYTIGVYVYRDCEYDIIAVRGKKIIRANYGDKFTLQTSREEPLIFEISNPSYRKTIDYIFWSDETLITAFVNTYSLVNDTIDEKTGNYRNGLLESIPTIEKNIMSFSTEAIGEPKRVEMKTLANCDSCSFLVALYPKDLSIDKSLVHFMMFSEYSTIRLKSGEIVKHVLKKNEKQNFRFVGDLEYPKVKVGLIVKKGEVELSREIFK